MATLISFTDGNFTAAGTWKTTCTGTGANAFAYVTTWTTITASYVASPTFTIPVSETIDGVILFLRLYADAATGTLTVGLFDGAVELTTGTLNIADLSPNDKLLDNDYVLVKFATPQTGDGGSDYTLKLKADVTNKVQSYRNSATAGDWWRVFRTTTTSGAAPTTGDALFVMGESLGSSHTVTMNETATTQYGEIAVGGSGILTYGYSAATNYVLRVGNYLRVGASGAFRIGTVANPIPRDSTAVLEFVCASMGQYYLVTYGGEITMQGLSRTSAKNVSWALLTADMGTSATSCSINADTGWKNGDVVALFPTGWTTGGGETVTLNADAGANSLAWTTGTSYTHKATTPTAGEVALLTRNVKVRSTSSSYYTVVKLDGYAPTVDLDWVEFQYCGATTVNMGALDTIASSHATIHVDYCSFYGGRYVTLLYARSVFYGTIAATYNVVWGMVNSADSSFNVAPGAGASITFTDNVLGVLQGANSNGHVFYNVEYCTVSRNRVAGGATGYQDVTGSDGTCFVAFEDNIVHSISAQGFYNTARLGAGEIHGFVCWGSNQYGMYFDEIVHDTTFVDCILIGCTTAGMYLGAGGIFMNVRVTNLTTRGDASRSSAEAILISSGMGMIDTCFDNCSFGATTAHTTAVLASGTSTGDADGLICSLRFRNCNFNSNTLVSNLPAGLKRGSWIAYEKHDTAPIHRRLIDTGWITIENTTFHAAAPSEKVAPSIATTTRRMKSTVRLLKIDGSATRTVSVWVYKDGSYAGSQPRLIALANPALGWNSDQVLDTMSGGASSWEELTGVTSVAGADGVVEVYVDCDGSAGAIYADDWTYS
jgi:hypothetical protein